MARTHPRHTPTRLPATLIASALAISGATAGDLTSEAPAQTGPGAPFPFLRAVPGASTNAALEEALAALDAPGFEAREAASARLADPGGFTEAELCAAAKRPALGPEQRDRLAQALRQRFLNSPRSALGVSMNAEPTGVTLTEVKPGFPACDALRAGDVVLQVDDIRLAPDDPGAPNENLVADVDPQGLNEAFRLAILSHLPGETVRLRLRRMAQAADRMTPTIVEVDAPLGRLDALAAMPNTVSPQEVGHLMASAWGLRARRLGLVEDDGKAIAIGEPVDSWVRSVRAGVSPGAGDGLYPAGHEASTAPTSKAGASLALIRDASRRRLAVNDGGVEIRVRQDPDGLRRAQELFAGQINEMQGRIESLRAEVSAPGTTPQRRAQLNRLILEGEESIRDLIQRFQRMPMP